MLCQRFGLDYGILHTCTLDSMGHRFYHDSPEMDHACFMMDYMLAPWITKWRDMGYQVIVTADHGQDARGHHGGQIHCNKSLRSIISGMRKLLRGILRWINSTGPNNFIIAGGGDP